MATNPWYVITGGPCAGKTTLIHELQRRGYRVVEEAARSYIEEEQAKGRSVEDIRKDKVAVQRTLLAKKIATERNLPKDEVIFFDRGMHDSITYFRVAGVPDGDPELHEAIRNTSYRKAFLLELLPFVNDPARTEDPETAKAIHHMLHKDYEEAGVEVLDVPILPTSERADFVLAHL